MLPEFGFHFSLQPLKNLRKVIASGPEPQKTWGKSWFLHSKAIWGHKVSRGWPRVSQEGGKRHKSLYTQTPDPPHYSSAAVCYYGAISTGLLGLQGVPLSQAQDCHLRSQQQQRLQQQQCSPTHTHPRSPPPAVGGLGYLGLGPRAQEPRVPWDLGTGPWAP